MNHPIRRFFRWFGLALSGWDAVAGAPYHHFKNIVLPTARGTTEIDHLIVSPFGLFVIENKRRSGWIFGDEFDPYWTSVHFSGKYRFQNPIHQNFGHVKALEELLGISTSKLHAAVVFRGRFRFKTAVPRNVFLHSCVPWVLGKTEVLLDDTQVSRILDLLTLRGRSGHHAGRDHARSVQAKLSSTTTCPKCGGALVERIAKRGPRPGSLFLGCSNYPRCKYIGGRVAT